MDETTSTTNQTGKTGKKGTKEKPIYLASYVTDQYLVEMVTVSNKFAHKPPEYRIWNGTGGPPTSHKGWRDMSTPILPPQDKGNLIGRCTFVASEVGESLDTRLLLERVREYMSHYLMLPKFWVQLASYYVLASWVYDRFGNVGYMRIMGEPNIGKTRFLKTIGCVCCRAIVVTSATSPAAMHRMLDQYRGTLVIDEADWKSSINGDEYMKILLVGYEDGATIVKCGPSGMDYEPQGFNVYGPKLFGAREKFEDEAMETRCFSYSPVRLQAISKGIASSLHPDGPFGKEGQEIRNLLLTWRGENYRKLVIDESELREVIKDSRLVQIATPIYTLAQSIGDTEFIEELFHFLLGTSEDAKFNDMETCAVIEAMTQLEVRDELVWVDVKDLTIKVNFLLSAECEKHELVSEKDVCSLLRGVGFDPQKGGHNKRTRFQLGSAELSPLVNDYLGELA